MPTTSLAWLGRRVDGGLRTIPEARWIDSRVLHRHVGVQAAVLVDLDLAKKHRFVIEHSPDDKLCPFRMAQLARTTLRQAGSEVTEVDYPGGHGWQGELFARIRTALQTLTQEQ